MSLNGGTLSDKTREQRIKFENQKSYYIAEGQEISNRSDTEARNSQDPPMN